MTRPRFAPLALAILLAPAATAHAQRLPADDRGYLTAAADFLVAGARFSDLVQPVTYGEPATVATTYHVGGAPGFAVGGGARVWRRLFVGAEISRVSRANDADVSAQVPHPFLFNKPRAVSGTATGLDRAELAVHVIASWVRPVSRRWQLAVGGGPSWITVDQDVATNVTINQTYPYDTATFAGVVTQKVSASRVGLNVGAEAAYRLRRRAAIALSGRYSYASVPLTATASTEAGGLHATAGLRLRF